VSAASDVHTPTAPSVPDARWGTPRRWGVFLLGVLMLGTGVALSITADVGVGSWQVFETGLVETTGLPFGIVVIIESLVALTLAWVWLKQPPGIATVVIALGLGPLVGVLLEVLPTPGTLPLGLAQFAVGTLGIGVGVGFYVAAELGPSAQDALFVGLYRHYPMRPGTARFLLDASLVVGGFALGGQLGLGTVVITLGLPFVVEPALRVGHRLAGTRPLADEVHGHTAAPA
jgi:uncharacterized membrane protein YczE